VSCTRAVVLALLVVCWVMEGSAVGMYMLWFGGVHWCLDQNCRFCSRFTLDLDSCKCCNLLFTFGNAMLTPVVQGCHGCDGNSSTEMLVNKV